MAKNKKDECIRTVECLSNKNKLDEWDRKKMKVIQEIMIN